MKKVVVLSLFLIFYAISSHAAQGPEIFVQTGHSSSVIFVALNESGNTLVTCEGHWYRGGFIKIWDTATGREIRTIKLESKNDSPNNIHFVDESRFIVFFRKSAEIFDVYGQKTASMNLPKIAGGFHNPAISKNGQYLFSRSRNFGTKIYSIKDGAQMFLPELKKYPDFEFYQHNVADLGYGYYGTFHKGQTPRGNVDYVIDDDNLNVRMKGSLNIPDISNGSKFKISHDLKQIAFKGGGESRDISIYNLKTGERLWSYKTRALEKSDEYLRFGFIPDGRLRVEYDRNLIRVLGGYTARMELVILNLIKNGIYTEKRVVLDNLDNGIGNKSNPYVITDKDMLIAGFNNGNVKMMDISTGAEIKSFGVKPSVFKTSYGIGNQIINCSSTWSATRKTIRLRFNLWDMESASLKKLNVTTQTDLYQKEIKIDDFKADLWFSTDPEALYSQIPADFFRKKYKKGRHYGGTDWQSFLLRNTGGFYTHTEQHKLVLFNRKISKKVMADLYAFDDGEWIVITPEGYYNASANGDKYLSVRTGNNIYGIENYREAFFRPDLVKIAIAGNSLEGYRTLASVASPPVINIENTPDKITTDSVGITIRITDTGGGIGDVRLYLNDTSVMTDSGRGIMVKAVADEKSIVRTYTLKLLNGENIIKAIAFDKENNVQSNPALKKITASYQALKKPVLYALVIGINEYKNPKLTLKYAKADAELFADVLQKTAATLFDKVNITRLTSGETSSKENILKELDKHRNINPKDVFVFYVASHGTVDDGDYYLITSNVGALSTEKLKADAITQKELRERIANVPAAKKLIVIDTCNAGKMGEQIQVAMLTRGMSEETAMKILSRAVGSTIISAATSIQEALEGYKEHGLFTYVLTEGMRGKADVSHSGYLKTSDLASYVEETVPDIAENVFKRAQYPTKAINGNDFPIGRIKGQ